MCDPPVVVQFGGDFAPRVAALLPVVDIFDRLLQADGDQKPDGDGGDMNEEISPAMDRRMGRMHARDIEDLIVATSDTQGKLNLAAKFLKFEELSLNGVRIRDDSAEFIRRSRGL